MLFGYYYNYTFCETHFTKYSAFAQMLLYVVEFLLIPIGILNTFSILNKSAKTKKVTVLNCYLKNFYS